MPTDDRHTVKLRMCLRCRKSFKSKHAGNRICQTCSVKHVDHGGRSVTLGEIEGALGRGRPDV